MAMRALTLDFLRTPRRTLWVGILLLIVGALVLGQVANHERALAGQIELADARLEMLAKGNQAKPTNPADAEARQQEIRRANEILQQLALPWRALFKVIEASNDKEIALLAIQPDAGKRVLRLAGEAKNFDALLAYIARLEQSPMLSQVYLSSHELRLQDAEKPVRFALVAHWAVQP
ncbi:MAG: PilN domain-containing protein [Hydrogenophilales bacterium]|nr:PilN domain-containing protein [Hydrogenophilales bacterium]